MEVTVIVLPVPATVDTVLANPTTTAGVVGFASTVSTVAGTGNTVTVTSISHPGLVAAMACLLGASFGLLSEYVATVLTREPAKEGSSAQ